MVEWIREFIGGMHMLPPCIYNNVDSLDRPFNVSFTHKSRSIYVGCFSTLEEAQRALKESRKQYPKEKKRKVKTWTAAELQELRDLPYPQKNYTKIAERMGRTVASVYMQHWKMNNVKR